MIASFPLSKSLDERLFGVNLSREKQGGITSKLVGFTLRGQREYSNLA